MKYVTNILIILALLVIAGCGHHKKKYHKPSVMVGPVAVIFPNVSEHHKSLLYESCMIHLEAFREDTGHQSIFTIVNIIVADSVDCNGKPVAGLAYFVNGRSDHIVVVVGDKLEIPVLYHELWHINTKNGDLDHILLDWRFINDRCAEIAQMIRDSRKDLQFDPPPQDPPPQDPPPQDPPPQDPPPQDPPKNRPPSNRPPSWSNSK